MQFSPRLSNDLQMWRENKKTKKKNVPLPPPKKNKTNITKKETKHVTSLTRKTWIEKKKKWQAYDTRYSQAVSHPSTDRALGCLTSVIGREPVYSAWCGRRRWLFEMEEFCWLLSCLSPAWRRGFSQPISVKVCQINGLKEFNLSDKDRWSFD